MCKTALVCLAAAFLAAPSFSFAQQSKERPFINAVRVEIGPRIDGVLDDAVWQQATPVETFTQQEPNLGQRQRAHRSARGLRRAHPTSR
jgi:hypothetical protein